MRWAALVANGVLIAGMGCLLSAGLRTKAVPIVRTADAPALAALEAGAALGGAAETVALAAAYLERDQPGLATAALDRIPPPMRARPDVASLEARALFLRGKPREALVMARDAELSCSTAPEACPAWLAAKVDRQVAFFDAVVGAGIEDPGAAPLATREAYDRSTREVRLVAMR